MKFSIALFFLFSVNIFADSQVSLGRGPLEMALVGKAIHAGVIAGQTVLEEAKRRASGWLGSLFSKSEPLQAMSSLEVTRRIRALKERLYAAQRSGNDEEIALIEVELEPLYEFRPGDILETESGLQDEKVSLMVPGMWMAPQGEGSKSDSNSPRENAVTSRDSHSGDDDEWLTGVTPSTTPGSLGSGTPNEDSDCRTPTDRPLVSPICHKTVAASNRALLFSDLSNLIACESALCEETWFWEEDGVETPQPPNNQIQHLLTRIEIQHLLTRIEAFANQVPAVIGERARFEVMTPDRMPLIVWVTRIDASNIEIELAGKRIGEGAKKVCYRSRTIQLHAHFSMGFESDVSEQAFLRFPVAGEGEELSSALALLDRSFPQGEPEELRLAGRLDLGRTHGGQVEASDQLYRGTLMDLREKMSPDQLLVVFQDVAITLGILHSVGLVHRDVKPPNIMIDHEGRGWLTDLTNLVRFADFPSAAEAVYTPGFLPMQFPRPSPIHDIFALERTAEIVFGATNPFHVEVVGMRAAHDSTQDFLSEPNNSWIEEAFRTDGNPQRRVEAFEALRHRFPQFDALLEAMKP